VARRLSPLLAVVLTAALVPAAQGSQERTRTMTITVLSLTRVSIPHDLPPKGKENKGDYIEYRDLLLAVGRLFGKQENQPVGWDKGTLTYTSKTEARIIGQAVFPGQGKLKVKGPMKELPNGSNTVKIIGGSGKFVGAKGVLIIGPGDQRALNTFRFTLPGGAVA
jgi:hypothetical protein